MHSIRRKLDESLSYIKAEAENKQPQVGLVLGSGLGPLGNEISKASIIDYKNIPYFPVSTVEGHAGKLIIGNLEGKEVIACQGRFHYYEGYDLTEVTYPIRIMQALGVHTLIVTNAAGGINKSFKPGDIMLIEDHINLLGSNPLRGKNEPELGPRFPDMTEAYAKELKNLATKAANELGITLKKGVYAAFSGPSYETPAEIRFLRLVGADSVGMSTVPEVIVANHANIKVLGISCITNMASGVLDRKLSHDEVVDTANKVQASFIKLVKKIIALLP
ncbi:MAG TPA: purine-nucleoside phosphorylase [Clostridia bacterium]|nr:purine-nucleoside phosphorylase [Clostridia bacterium]